MQRCSLQHRLLLTPKSQLSSSQVWDHNTARYLPAWNLTAVDLETRRDVLRDILSGSL